MKFNIPIAIIISAIIISISIYLSSFNDPLAKCMDKLSKETDIISAAEICTGQ